MQHRHKYGVMTKKLNLNICNTTTTVAAAMKTIIWTWIHRIHNIRTFVENEACLTHKTNFEHWMHAYVGKMRPVVYKITDTQHVGAHKHTQRATRMCILSMLFTKFIYDAIADNRRFIFIFTVPPTVFTHPLLTAIPPPQVEIQNGSTAQKTIWDHSAKLCCQLLLSG